MSRSRLAAPGAGSDAELALEGIVEFGATILAENTAAIALIRATGWPLASTSDGAELTVTMAIDTRA